MKKLLVFATAVLTIIRLDAQPPQGGMGGGMGGGRPDGPPRGEMGQRPTTSIEETLTLEVFPEIPDLSLKQRERVGSIITKEMKDVSKQMKKRHELMVEKKEPLTEKELTKNKEKSEKIDKKIAEIKEKSNKKIKKELSEEQYKVFIEKRDDFKFKRQRRGGSRMGDGERRERPARPSFDGGNGPEEGF